jgi:hypothetical protein
MAYFKVIRRACVMTVWWKLAAMGAPIYVNAIVLHFYHYKGHEPLWVEAVLSVAYAISFILTVNGCAI